MKPAHSVLSALALILPAASATALPVAMPCPGCTAAQAQSTALASYRSTGQSTQYVYDLPGNQFWAFSVDIERNIAVGTQTSFRNLAVSSSMQATFAEYRAAWIANNRSEAFHYTVPIYFYSPSSVGPTGLRTDDGFLNTFDVLTTSAANRMVSNCLGDGSCTDSAMQGVLVEFLSQFSNSMIDFKAMNVTVVVKFHDGSEMEYKLNTQTGKWEPIAGTAYDSHGNLLNPFPKTPPQRYFNGGSNGYDGSNLLQLFGPVPLLNGAPYCATIWWDGVSLTCEVAGG